MLLFLDPAQEETGGSKTILCDYTDCVLFEWGVLVHEQDNLNILVSG